MNVLSIVNKLVSLFRFKMHETTQKSVTANRSDFSSCYTAWYGVRYL